MSRSPADFLEPLEHRRHFAVAAEAATPTSYGICGCGGCGSARRQQSTMSLQASDVAGAGDFNVRINFAPNSAPKVRGHKIDYGVGFSRRGNGLQYGWTSDRRKETSYTDDARFNSAKAESGTKMNGASWSIAVPNGWYDVRASMGTPANLDAYYSLTVNGQALVKGEPYKPAFPWVEGVELIQVTGGRITINSAGGSRNNFLCSVAITSTDAPAAAIKGADISWSRTGIESPLHRAEAGAVRVGNKMYILGGYTNAYNRVSTRVDVMDLNTGRTTQISSLPGAQTHFGVATDGVSIYVAGGQYGPMLSNRGTSEVWKFDIATNKWSAFASLPTIRFGGSMAYMDGRLHFTGGNDKTRVRSKDEQFIFDLRRPAKGWYAGADLPSPTDHHSSIVLNGKLYVIGGEVEHGTSYLQNNGFFEYDPAANAWNVLPPLPVASSHNETSTLTDGKRIFLIGGQGDQQQLISDVRSYDFKKGRWDTHNSMPTARKAGISWMTGNRVFYMTGDDANFGEPKWTYQGIVGK